MLATVEYIWLDGSKPTQKLRSKTRIVELKDPENVTLKDFPIWSYDGSSTYQSQGHQSDLLLHPVYFVPDPIRGEGFLVLNEVYQADGTPHSSNTRQVLRRVLQAAGNCDPWFGFEQEYTFFSGHRPLGWPEHGFPKPQGPFYCAIGSEEIFGREIVEEHRRACLIAGLTLYGTNAEVMPSQWEYQVGYRGFSQDRNDALEFTDHQWLCRWLLCRIAEDYKVTVSFDNKPVKGDWNGTGCHANFSTKAMRDPKTGLQAIEKAINLLKGKHREHIAVYGDKLEERLTGHHETCNINEFRSGVAHRGASIRIPQQVKERGCGYLEDRRPGANSDPYLVAARLITTVQELDEKVFTGAASEQKAVREPCLV